MGYKTIFEGKLSLDHAAQLPDLNNPEEFRKFCDFIDEMTRAACRYLQWEALGCPDGEIPPMPDYPRHHQPGPPQVIKIPGAKEESHE